MNITKLSNKLVYKVSELITGRNQPTCIGEA